jgi:hypothetical protein
MTATCPDQDASTEEHPAFARIEPARQMAGMPVIRGHRPPRWAVRLDPPQEAGPLLQRVKDDYAALVAQVEAEHQAKVRAVHQQFNRGDMTPNERATGLAAAAQERAARLQRVEQQMGHLLPGAITEQARAAALDAIGASCRDALAAHRQRSTKNTKGR